MFQHFRIHARAHWVRVVSIVLAVLAFGVVRDVHAATFNPGCTAGVGDTAALIGALALANSNGQDDVINLVAGCTYTTPLVLTIASDSGNMISLNGGGATIAGNTTLTAVIDISAQAEAVINRVTITQGRRGIQNAGLLTLNESIITANVGSTGISNTNTLIVRRSTISNNTSPNYGGGIFSNTGAYLEINNSTLSGNSATVAGGGIYSAGSMLISSSTLSNNTAQEGGGGVFVIASNNSFINSTFIDNEAPDGGAIYYGDPITIYDSTFSGNDSTFFGSPIGSPSLLLYNSIVADSAGAACGPGTFTVAYSLIEGGGCGAVNGVNGNKTGVDPALAAATGNPAVLPLTTDSPAIDVGNNALIPAGVTRDQTGRPRILTSTVDMGAYEYAPPTSLTVHLSLQGRPNPPGSVWVNTFHIEIRPTGQTTPYKEGDYVSDNFGRIFLTDLFPGSYDLWIKGSHTLAQIVPVLLLPGTDLTGMGSALLEGDVNDDNTVQLIDFSLLAAAFGTATGNASFNPQADLNGDGQIQLIDFSLLASNFGKAGTP